MEIPTPDGHRDDERWQPPDQTPAPAGLTLRLDVGAFVVAAGDHLVLIDAGTGLRSRWRGPGGRSISGAGLARSLAGLGFAPADFTHIFLSHLHFDHIGWVSVDGEPFFPDAVVRCEQTELDHILSGERDESYFARNWGAAPAVEHLRPVMERIETWRNDERLLPGIEAIFTPGHTPGSCIFRIGDESARALILGDVVHSPQELVDPDFRIRGGHDQPEAEASFALVCELIRHPGTYVSAPHFPGRRFAVVEDGTDGLPALRWIS
jgi:glyoxylase-like metal-dependent hydrolase (beta-lactamase superfamily II)